MEWLWLLVPTTLLFAAFLWFLVRRTPTLPIEEARKRFLQQREHLEAEFLTAATRTGKPRGLRWKNCDWESEVVLARERSTRRLTALVSVTIRFEAIEGSDMEGLPAVGNLRHASAVFYFDAGRWRTSGKAVFNLNPSETLQHFKGQYETI